MSRSLRILHVSEAFGGGIVGVVAPLAERLTGAGHSVAVAYGVRPETPADVRNELSDDVEVFPLPWHRRTMREQVRAAKALRRLAAEWEPDVVHLHSSFAGVVGSMALARRYVLVYSPHGYSFTRTTDAPLRRLAYRAAERYVARRVDVVAAVSESEAAQARAGVRAPAVEVVPNGIPELDPGALPTCHRGLSLGWWAWAVPISSVSLTPQGASSRVSPTWLRSNGSAAARRATRASARSNRTG